MLRARKRTAVRSTAALASPIIAYLDVGDTVRVAQEVCLERPQGLRRMQIIEPCEGWVTATCLELVPETQLDPTLTAWLWKKWQLGDDVLLAGVDRGQLISIALQFCANEINNHFEYCAISKDTSANDLCQRLELGPARVPITFDGPAVVAAIKGRILILDGIDRAQANVLPALHNLIEHREISLDDGTVIPGPHTQKAPNTRCVSENLWVIALASSSALARRPLDPPLRSRFAARLVAANFAASLHIPEMPRLVPTILDACGQQLKPSGILDDVYNESYPRITIPVVKVLTVAHRAVRHGGCGFAAALRAFPMRLWPENAKTMKTEQTMPVIPISSDDIKLGEYATLAPSRQATVRSLLFDVRALDAHLVLCGHSGAGKTRCARALATALGYRNNAIETLNCHNEMCSRDLVSRRDIDSRTGASIWRQTPLSHAVRRGSLVILDGCDRLGPGILTATIASLVAPITDDEAFLVLPDGEVLKPKSGFRLVLLANSTNWIDSDLASFRRLQFHELTTWTDAERLAAIPHEFRDEVVTIIKRLERSALTCNFKSPRTVQRLVTILRRDGVTVTEACRRVFEVPIRLTPGCSFKDLFPAPADTLLNSDGLKYDWRKHASTNNNRPDLVPSITRRQFVETPAVSKVTAAVAQNIRTNTPCLLLGDQGVGKNMLVDYVLSQLKYEKEYLQLHRDSSVASITTTPYIFAGPQDSKEPPLVRAAICGRVLVIDEADKAPLAVAVLIKDLVDNRETILGDGRKLLDCDFDSEDNFLRIHRDFRVVVLANRPGWPFQGRDFYSICGSVFEAHWVDHPDLQSQVKLMGGSPTSSVSDALMNLYEVLARAFEELRCLQAFPYSTRELARIARHLTRFGLGALSEALDDVFALELDPACRETIRAVLRRHLACVESLTNETKDSLQSECDAASEASFEASEVYKDENEDTDAAEEVEEDERNFSIVEYGNDDRGPSHEMTESEIEYLRERSARAAANVRATNAQETWVKHQTSGDLDESKLVDAITGSASVYKRRGVEVSAGALSSVKLLVDLNYSTYESGLVNRILFAVLVVVEALEGIPWSLVGFSGTGPEVLISKRGVDTRVLLQRMNSHAQCARRGDGLPSAIRAAIGKRREDQLLLVITTSRSCVHIGDIEKRLRFVFVEESSKESRPKHSDDAGCDNTDENLIFSLDQCQSEKNLIEAIAKALML